MKKTAMLLTILLTISPYTITAQDFVPLRLQAVNLLAPLQAVDPNAQPIYTADDLRKMTGSDASFVLMNDIDLSEYATWNPIVDFSGVFDGQGYRISNMKSIAKNNNNMYYAGLFGTISWGTVIKNVIMLNAQVDLSLNFGYSHYAGVIAAHAMGSALIENCAVQCNVDAKTMKIISSPQSSTGVNAYVGGMVGYAAGEIQVKGCAFVGVLDLQMSAVPGTAYTYCGGMVGYAYHSVLEGCVTFGGVRAVSSGQEYLASNYTAEAYAYAGGCVGYIQTEDSTFDHCVNNAQVFSEASAAGSSFNRFALNFSGGIAGRVVGNSSFTNCSNYGTIDGFAHISQAGASVAEATSGGIVGSAFTFTPTTLTVDFINCESVGEIVNAVAQGSSEAWASSGAIIGGATNNCPTLNKGFVRLTIEDCIGETICKTQSDSNSYSHSFSGGLIGMMQSRSAGVDLIVKNSRHTGEIIAEIVRASATMPLAHRGGMAGRLSANSGNVQFEPYCRYTQTEIEPIGNLSTSITVTGENNVNPQTVVLTFEPNGGSNISNIEVIPGDAINELPTPIREGYYFDGWYAEQELINKIVHPYTILVDTILYAKWVISETLVHQVDLANISGHGSPTYLMSVYKITTNTDYSYKITVDFKGMTQNMCLYAASYNTNGRLKELVSVTTGSEPAAKLDLLNIPKEILDGTHKIMLWDKNITPQQDEYKLSGGDKF